MSDFLKGLTASVEKIKRQIDKDISYMFDSLAENVLYNCPVLRGNLINDFHPAINGYNLTTLTEIDDQWQSVIGPNSNVNGDGSRARLKALKKEGTFYNQDGFISFSTSTPYAYIIEYDGWSRVKAPQGFMRVSLLQTAEKLKSGSL